MAKHSSHILELARRGAEHRYRELKAEIALLREYFPDLAGASRPERLQIDVSSEPAALIDQPLRKRRRRAMSAAARKAVSDRMRKYWAARRKAKAAGKKR